MMVMILIIIIMIIIIIIIKTYHLLLPNDSRRVNSELGVNLRSQSTLTADSRRHGPVRWSNDVVLRDVSGPEQLNLYRKRGASTSPCPVPGVGIKLP